MALEDFSMSATIVPFDPPVPLLRGPVAAELSDEPSSRSFVLAFRDAASWRAAFRATESKIVQQCEAGARAGCSISVSNTCKPPWWRFILGVKSTDFAEREQCEEREMSSCMASAKVACSKFAREKCIPAFQEARIVARGSTTYKVSMSFTDTTNRGSPDFNHPGMDSSSGHTIGTLGVVFLAGGLAIFFLFCFTLIICFYFRTPTDSSNSKNKDEEAGLDMVALKSWSKIKYADVKHRPEGRRPPDARCSVCLEDFCDEDELRLIQQCEHLFHTQCVDLWLQKHMTCPLCRSFVGDGGRLDKSIT